MIPQNTTAALQGGETSYLDYDSVVEFKGDVFAANTAIKGNPEDADRAVHDELVFDLGSTEKREADPEVTAAAERLEHRWGYRIFKRGMDIAFSGLVLVLFCWLFAIIAIAIKIDDPKGPVFFKQKRVGRTENGEQTSFEMYKFRSMYNGAEEQLHSLKELNEKSGPVSKIKNDPRIDLRIIETNTRRPLSALVFASVFPPKNTDVSALFPQVKSFISTPAEIAGNILDSLASEIAVLSKKVANLNFALFRPTSDSCPAIVGGGGVIFAPFHVSEVN